MTAPGPRDQARRLPEAGFEMHVPLSQRLGQLLIHSETNGRMTLNGLLEQTEGRGFYLVLILLCLPFATPIPIPGISSLLGLVIIILAGRLALGLPPRLPKLLGEKPVAWSRHPKLVRGSLKLLRFIEKFAKPRRSDWLSWRMVHLTNAGLIVLMALMLALPLPLPFTNTLPAYAIIFLSASMMEEDGVMVWWGYATALGTVIYFGLLSGAIVGILIRHFSQWMAWLKAWL